jgi:hypothetical protein
MKKILLFLSLIALLSTGCTKQNSQYYWCNYSESYYNLAQNNSEEALIEHKAKLEEIVAEAQKHNTAVPPGIYVEYGFLLFKAGKPKDAISWYEKEKKLYPESAAFVEMLTRVAEKSIAPPSSEDDTAASSSKVHKEQEPEQKGNIG